VDQERVGRLASRAFAGRVVISTHTIFLVIALGAFAAWVYGAYHYWTFYNKFGNAQLRGQIPPGLQRRRMGIGWLIASPGVVPGGDTHRRKAMYGIGAFVALWVIAALLAILVR
jgi:hypothetical protein